MSGGQREFRVALIGFGLGGESFHAPLIATTPGMKLATVVTANAERQAKVLREYPGAQVVPSADWLWQHASAHDLVVITTPNRVHASLALAALEAGLPVVIDKPFARTAAEAREIIAAAHARRKALAAYHIRRWDSEYLTLRRLMSEGSLGRVLRFESRLDRWRPALKGGWRERGAAEEAGGLLYDLGSHLIDQALQLFGPVAEVYAELDRRRAGAEADDEVFLALTHTNGVRSHLSMTYLAAMSGPRVRVLGDRGAFVKLTADPQEAALRSGARPTQPGWGEEPPEHWGVFSDGTQERRVKSEPGAYRRFYELMVATLREGAPPPVDPEDAVAGLEVIEAALRSAAERRLVTLASR